MFILPPNLCTQSVGPGRVVPHDDRASGPVRQVFSRAASGAISYANGRARCVISWEAYAWGVSTLTYEFRAGDAEHELRLVPVPGTKGTPYLFGAGPNRRPIEVRDFHIAITPVTQALWMHVMGSNTAERSDLRRPVE